MEVIMADRVHTRIDPELKKEVVSILNQLGLSEGDAIRIFYHKIKQKNGLPFDLRIPNSETLEAFSESDHDAPTLKKHQTFAAFKKSLKTDNS